MTEVKPEEHRPEGRHQGAGFEETGEAGRGDGVAAEQGHRELARAGRERGGAGRRSTPLRRK